MAVCDKRNEEGKKRAENFEHYLMLIICFSECLPLRSEVAAEIVQIFLRALGGPDPLKNPYPFYL